MKRIKENIPVILMLLVIGGAVAYSLWYRHLPQAEGRITGDYAEGSRLAGATLPLFVAVDDPPH